MKILFLALLLLSAPSWAESYLGCGLGLMRHGWPEADWLRAASGQLASTSCFYQADPDVHKEGLLWSLPSLTWQQDIHSSDRLQDHSSLQSFKQFEGQWLLWRQDAFLFGLIAGRETAQHQRQLSTNMRWLTAQNLLLKGEWLDLKQTHSYQGVVLDLRYLDSPIQELRLTRHHYEQPLRINVQNQPTLSRTELNTWQLALGRPAQGFGWLWHWQAGVAQGEVSNASYPNVAALDNDDFLDLNLKLGLMWRYRYSSHLHPYLDLSAQGQWWLFGNGGNYQVLPESTQQYGYQINTGLSWRF